MIDQVVVVLDGVHERRNAKRQCLIEHGGDLVLPQQIVQSHLLLLRMPYRYAVVIDLRQVKVVPLNDVFRRQHRAPRGHGVGNILAAHKREGLASERRDLRGLIQQSAV